ncbi:MAG: hypothetical protein OHK005_01490 [Candidatus Methylacidiphilales bacterium]
MGLFNVPRDPWQAEMRRLEREVRELEEQARKLEAGLGLPPEEVPEMPQPSATRITFPDQGSRPKPPAPGHSLRVQRRQTKLQVLAMGAVCVVLGVLVARVLGWM